MEYIVVIVSGVVAAVLFTIGNIQVTMLNLFYLFIIVLVLVLLVSIIMQVHINQKIKKYLKVNDYNYLKIEKSILKIKDPKIKNVLLLNLATALSIKSEYPEALKVLKKMDITKASELIRVCYYNNLALFFFKTGDLTAARKVVKQNKSLFNEYLTNIQLAPALISTIEQIEKKQKSNSK